MAFKIYEYTDITAYYNDLVLQVCLALHTCIETKGHACLAVSGGKSPIAFFELLSKQDLDWSKVSIALVDERIVAHTHGESNTALVQKHLIKNRAIRACFIPILKNEHTMVEELLVFANAHYQQADIAILGMGTDGHTASLFADSPEFAHALSCKERIVCTTPQIAHFRRLTMSFHALISCEQLFLVFQGIEKKNTFDKAALRFVSSLPISHVLHAECMCDVYYCA